MGIFGDILNELGDLVGVQKSMIVDMIKKHLNNLGEDVHVDLDRSEGILKLQVHLYGDADSTNLSVKYEIWKEKDSSKDNKRYVLHLINANCSKDWIDILLKQFVVGTHMIWYRKEKYSKRVHSKQENMDWKRKNANGDYVISRHSGADFYIPDTIFKLSPLVNSNDIRKALYKALNH